MKIILSLILLSLPLGLSASPTTDISGFVDVQYQHRSRGQSPGFRLYDSALYFSVKTDSASLNVDLPFSSEDQDATTKETSSDFKFAKEKAQAYLTLNEGGEFSVMFGQMDSLFGYEAADSNELTFTTPSIVTETALPGVILGGVASWMKDSLSAKAYVSNVSDHGAKDGNNLEFGGIARFDQENFYLAAGGKTYKKNKKFHTFYDFLAGVTVSILKLDAEFDLRKEGSITGYAALGHLVADLANVSEGLTAGLRGAFQRKMHDDETTLIPEYQHLEITAGPQYQWSDNVKLKTDYSWASEKAVSSSRARKMHSVNAGVVFSF